MKIRILRLAAIFLLALCCSSCGLFLQRNAPYYHAGTPWKQLPHMGIVEEVEHATSVKGPSHRRMLVYLPADYYDNDRRYPVYYLLHGARGHETAWISRGDVLRLTASLFTYDLAEKYILVLPNVNQYNDDKDFDDSRYKDAFESLFEVNGAVETGFVEDVVKTVDSLYRTIPDKRHRAIAGLSIGGLQSIWISARNPDTFGYIGAFSAMLHPFQKPSPYNKFYSQLKPALDIQFREAPDAYILFVGDTDFYYGTARRFDKYLTRKGYPHDLVITKGGHEWYNWTAYYCMLARKAFRD